MLRACVINWWKRRTAEKLSSKESDITMPDKINTKIEPAAASATPSTKPTTKESEPTVQKSPKEKPAK
jgi:hypothetical protein